MKRIFINFIIITSIAFVMQVSLGLMYASSKACQCTSLDQYGQYIHSPIGAVKCTGANDIYSCAQDPASGTCQWTFSITCPIGTVCNCQPVNEPCELPPGIKCV